MVLDQINVVRLQPLVSQEAAAKQDLDNALDALEANKANVAALTANVDQTRLQTRTNIDSAAAQVESNKALLRTAELNLDYATIEAPISGRIGDITRMTPQAAGGNGTFVGQDNRANNITIDGSYFNGSFGLDMTTGGPGDRTGVAPTGSR